jgi:hypothetical protein
MADQKISQLTSLTGANTASGDLVTIVDISDTTMGASGTNKKMTLAEFQASPVSAGTANGVVYLDGSKVATAGSSLVFDGTNLGVGTASPSYRLDVVGSTSTARFGKLTITNDAPFLTGANIDSGANSFAIGASGASPVAFFTNNTERMRLDASGNLGIGTTSPGQRLEIQAPAGVSQNAVIRLRATDSASSAGSVADISAIGTGGQVSALAFSTRDGVNIVERMRLDGAGNLGIGTASPAYKLDVLTVGAPVAQFRGPDNGYVDVTDGVGIFRTQISSNIPRIGSSTNHPVIFTTNNIERMRLDASGNLGIGVVPSVSTSSGLYLKNNGNISYGGTISYYDSNSFFSSSADRYVINGAATRYQHNAGEHRWFNAVSGTAGNAITFTQAMTLDASGNLGIGTSSPAGFRVRVVSASADADVIRWENSASSIYAVSGVSTTNSLAYIGTGTNNAFAFITNNIERMRLDVSGNLGLGVTPSAWSGLKAFEFAGVGSSLASAANNNVFLSANAWYNGTNWCYGITAAASQYQSFSGAHAWLTAPSGPAGSPITFSEAMRFDSLGLTVTGTNITGPDKFRIFNATSGAATHMLIGNTGQSMTMGIDNGGLACIRLNSSSLGFFNNVTGFEVMRIHAGGKVDIGSVTQSEGLGIGTATFGTSARSVIAIANGVAPTTGPADTIQIFSVDRSAGNTIPAVRCEGSGVTNAGITNTTVTNKIAISVNGTIYYLLATTNAT